MKTLIYLLLLCPAIVFAGKAKETPKDPHFGNTKKVLIAKYGEPLRVVAKGCVLYGVTFQHSKEVERTYSFMDKYHPDRNNQMFFLFTGKINSGRVWAVLNWVSPGRWKESPKNMWHHQSKGGLVYRATVSVKQVQITFLGHEVGK